MSLIIKLPEKFRAKLRNDPKLEGATLSTVGKFSDWLSANKTEFFPEYTDHGIDHVQSVLDCAESLITDASWEIISAEDIYVLTSAILLHDCAMHINSGGLWDLLERDAYNGVLLGFDSETEWKVRWDNFSTRVDKFDEIDFNNLFSEQVSIAFPKFGEKDLSNYQKILIGDFLRKYHACIAQVIATYGMPTKKGPLKLFDESYQYLNQLAGFVARSHNYSLRKMTDILGNERARTHRGTVPAYLMGVLRIADYLQIEAERTPKLMFEITGFCSPISISEWKKHLALISSHGHHPDEELLYFEASPDDPETLTKLLSLLRGLQKELDDFWSVMGEIYSRYSPLNTLSITYRRVKSNIDSPEKYVNSNHKNFYPEVLRVHADNQKLFPLLIKPLYGDSPQIGLRELIQNGVDACNERLCSETGKDVTEIDNPYSIEITLDKDNNRVTVRDQGTGMNIEILKDYFFKIGSSYRTSEKWKANYERGDESLVPRTGKFGIGMLAGFLIGQEVTVTTKHHLTTERGLSFTYKLDSSYIEIRYSNTSTPGTEITLESNPEVLGRLIETLTNESAEPPHHFYRRRPISSGWWYFLDSPKIGIQVLDSGKMKDLEPRYQVRKSDIFESWNKVENSKLEGFYWRRNSNQPTVYCNGIVLRAFKSPKINIDNGMTLHTFDDLEICIFDNRGIFPLNLTRTALLTNKFYEYELLEKSFARFLIREIQDICIIKNLDPQVIKKLVDLYRPAYYEFCFCPMIIGKKEIVPFGSQLTSSLNELTFVDFLYPPQKRGLIFSRNFNRFRNELNYSCFLNVRKEGSTVFKAICNFVLNLRVQSLAAKDYVGIGQKLQAWIFVTKFDYEKLAGHELSFLERNDICTQQLSDGWIVVSKDRDIRKFPQIARKIIGERPNIFIFSLYRTVEESPTPFTQFWDKYAK